LEVKLIRAGFLRIIPLLFALCLLLAADVLALESKHQVVPQSEFDSSKALVDSTGQGFTELRTKTRIIRKPGFFSGSFSLAEAYDDNILQYSAADLQLLENNLEPTKFAIRTPGDFRTSFDLRTDLNPALFHDNRTRLRFRFGTDFFARSGVKNYQLYGVEAKQNFWRENYFQAGFRYIPHFYLRNLLFFDPALGLHRYAEAIFSKQSYLLELGRRFSSRLAVSLGSRYEKTDYNSEFDERDSEANSFYGDMKLDLSKQVAVGFEYAHKESRARGRDMALAEDVSNRTDQVSLRLDLNLGRALGIPLSFAPSAAYEYQKYTTPKTPDRYHYGRKDNYYRMTSELSCRWSRHFDQFLRYSYEKNKTNLQGTLDVGDYQAHRISSGVTCLF